MASFEAWDSLVRQTIICVKQTIAIDRFGDVMERVRENQARDPEQEMLQALMEAWFACFGSSPVSAQQLIKEAEQGFGGDDTPNDRLRLALNDLTPHGGLVTVSLGRQLAYRKGRIVGGLWIEEAGKRDGTKLWRVASVQEKKS